MQTTYLFYDTETSGINPAFDQILQFAAIRTDTELKEIERADIRIKLRPDIIISPGAIITHRIPVADARKGTCEYEAAKQLHHMLNEPGTISIGYNTLGFDDAFLRFTFYRNLLPPYAHQYDKGCRRMDLLPMTVLYCLYRRDGLRWPEVNGKPTLKLEHLSAANQLAKGSAHNAMVDVEATLALARILKKNQAMWQYLEKRFIKDMDGQQLNKLPVVCQSENSPHRLGILTDTRFGPEFNYQAPVLSIGNSHAYRNQTLWLRMDLPELREAAPDTIADTTWVIRKRLGEPGIILPPHDRYWQRINPHRQEQVAENLEWFKTNGDLRNRIIQYHRDFRYPEIPDLDADAALYQIGFFSTETLARFDQYHRGNDSDRKALIRKFAIPELQTLALRIFGRNYPDRMSTSMQQEFSHYMRRIHPPHPDLALLDFKGDRRTTPRSALAEIDRMLPGHHLDDMQRKLLHDLKADIAARFAF